LLLTLGVANASDFALDANELTSTPGLADTVGFARIVRAEFISYPITEFQYARS
jgi:hypothetical protein